MTKFNNSRLKHLYGIDSGQLYNMMEEQKWKCKICGDNIYDVEYIDHNHKTGKVRGLLCNLCNSMLGFARDNPFILIKAVEYLKHQK